MDDLRNERHAVMNSFTIEGISQDQIDSLIGKLQADASVSSTEPNKWTITGHGIASSASYDPATEVLTVVVESKPFFISLATIESTLRKNL